MSHALFNDFSCALEELPPARDYEFTAFSGVTGIFMPGTSSDQQFPALLPIAPGRWFAPSLEATTESLMEAASNAGSGTVIDVSGKWYAMTLVGRGASRLLASTIDIEAVLLDRPCAALTLFDCPAIVARSPLGFSIWVHSSYATHFAGVIQQLGATRSAAVV